MTNEILTDSRDRVIFGETPMLLQPRFGEPLPPPCYSKHRFLCGSDGIYLEAQNDVIAVRVRIAKSSVNLPYGNVEQQGIQLKNGQIPTTILDDAKKKARDAAPNEWACYIVWNVLENRYEIFEPLIIASSEARVSYLSLIPVHFRVVVDLHSHGSFSAFFSDTDNISDLAGFYLAAVIGNCLDKQPSLVSRMVVNGNFLPCPKITEFFL